MATIEMVAQCAQLNRERGRRMLSSKKTVSDQHKPDLKGLFGEEVLVKESELDRCGEAEQRRHLYEDSVLRFLYIEN